MVVKAFIRRSRMAGVASVGAWVVLSGCAAHRSASAATPETESQQEEGAVAGASSPAASDVNANALPAAPAPATAASSRYRQVGEASYYSHKFQGRRTASGERYDMHALTAAHRTLPLGSYVRVSNLSKTKSVVVRINDRGPFAKSRVIDLSFAAATVLGLQRAGRARVVLEPVEPVMLQLAGTRAAPARLRTHHGKAAAKPLSLHISHGRHRTAKHKR